MQAFDVRVWLVGISLESHRNLAEAGRLPRSVYAAIFSRIPANMHPFRPQNQQNREKPAIMHLLESFSRIQEGKAQKACIIAGFLLFSPDLLEKACTFAGFQREGCG
ncbi:hypothetical protein BC351_19980 [Paenibacillus ferrarius]|uniref:Uncharacterized protein n=1 Tax=Paenibacillus ferrarius TaxID=1469647 RepID=A0A1V4HP49_9BACL|nr:hypothetical protein [Paenibacillus ferrarius]OPH59762.1 hypothetical protein BC351_19980 [Paenibacillus ferrarius]